MKQLISAMEAEVKDNGDPRFTPKTIINYYLIAAAVFATAKDRKGKQLFPRQWDRTDSRDSGDRNDLIRCQRPLSCPLRSIGRVRTSYWRSVGTRNRKAPVGRLPDSSGSSAAKQEGAGGLSGQMFTPLMSWLASCNLQFAK
jgi:hypothetical protein